MTPSPDPYRCFRYPAEVIKHAVWLYHLFRLYLRYVELILAVREVVVSDETVRERGLRFGRLFANELKRRRPRPGDTRYVDEVFIRIRGKLHSPWRAVDQHGHVLDVLVQSRRSATAAKRFFRKLLKGLQYVPRVIVTDKLGRYAASKREILPGWSVGRATLSTSAPRCHTSRHGGEKARGRGSSHRVTPNGSSPFTAGSTSISNPVVTA
jgi:putative transposase